MRKKSMKKLKTDWDTIYKNPGDYQYYDVFQAHQDLGKIITLFKQESVKRVLDLGCGVGRNLFPLQEAGFEVYGIDSAPNGVNHILASPQGKFLSGKIVVGKFQSLPHPDGFFDAVISIQTLNHGYEADVVKGIGEIERVLKPKGLIYITLPGRISKGKVRYCLVKTAEKVDSHTYLPTIGDEIGVPHFIFNKKLIRNYFANFFELSITRDDKDYYCVLAKNRA